MLKYIQTLNGDLQPSKRGNYYRVVDVDRHISDLKAEALLESSDLLLRWNEDMKQYESKIHSLKVKIVALIGVIVILIGKLL